MPDPATIASITIDPEPAAWAGLLKRPSLIERSRVMRTQLGLTLDRPIIMSGHQPGFWHPGIAAKFLAMSSAARHARACPAWLVVDQDEHDPSAIRFPLRNEGGRLRVATWQSIDRALGVAKGVPVGATPACPPEPLPSEAEPGYAAAIPSVAAGLARIHQRLGVYASSASVARQFASAANDELAGLVSAWGEAPKLLYALELSRTDLFGMLVGRMIEDPARCARTYNDAVAAFPEADLAPLRLPPGNDAGRVELPLWAIDRGGAGSRRAASPVLPARLRVSAGMLGTTATADLAPRALLMTAMLRLGGCDLFIHGTGGGAYDRVTDRWIKEWLGETLAPTAVVTATMYLPLGAEPARAADAARAQWTAHHARHDPAALGDEASALEKAALVAKLRAGKRRGEETRTTYRELHALLARVRDAHALELRELEAQAEQARARLADADVIGDRTWPFPLFDAEDLVRLRDEIDRRFASTAVAR